MTYDWNCHHPDQLGLLMTSETALQQKHRPFQDHTAFALMIDVLSRKYQPHLILEADYDAAFHPAFLNAFIAHLAEPGIPASLKQASLLYLNIKDVFAGLHPDNARLSLTVPLQKRIDESSHCFILAYTCDPLPAPLNHIWEHALSQFAKHPRCRLIQLTHDKTKATTSLPLGCTTLTLPTPNEQDTRLVLTQLADELQKYHRVSIPADLIDQALTLSQRFLSNTQPLEKAILLLDSTAARTSANNTNNTASTEGLTAVLASWINIPATHLQPAQFKASELIKQLQQRLFGQDQSLPLLAQPLQEAHAKLQTHLGPFFHALLAGPAHTGKTTAILSTIEYLFRQLNLVYLVKPSNEHHSLLHLPAQRYTDKRLFAIADILETTPHAVFIFEDIDQYSPHQHEQLEEMLTTGALQHQHHKSDFKQSMVFMTTALEPVLYQAFIKPDVLPPTKDNSLLQLVMQQTQQLYQEEAVLSADDLLENILPALQSRVPERLLKLTTLIPFIPLSRQAYDKLIRHKVTQLSKQLENRYGTLLTAAPEVFRFLVEQAAMSQHEDSLEKILKPLYACVEQALLAKPANLGNSGQLFLQLHETGQLLRCEWIGSSSLAMSPQH